MGSRKTLVVFLMVMLQAAVALIVFFMLLTKWASPHDSGVQNLIDLDVIDGWSEYVGARQLYKFEYPTSWQVVNVPDGSILLVSDVDNEAIPFSVELVDDTLRSEREKMSKDSSLSFDHEQETMINNYAARELVYNAPLNRKLSVFYVPIGKGESAVIKIGSDNVTHRRILETMEFLKTKSK